MQIPDISPALWEWLLDPGGLIAALAAAAVVTLSISARKKIAVAIDNLKGRHAERMRAKYAAPCERVHVDDPFQFQHPAKFEVHGQKHTESGATRCVLVNVGHGDAFAVLAGTDPFGNVTVRGPASWDAMKSGAEVPIQLVCDVSDRLLDQSIQVAWRDALGPVSEVASDLGFRHAAGSWWMLRGGMI